MGNLSSVLSWLLPRTDEEAMWQVKMQDDHRAFARLVAHWEVPIRRLKELQENYELVNRQARATLQEKQRRMRENILGEIKDVVKLRAKAGHYTCVIDTAAETVNNTPVLLYTNGDNDLTDEVLKELNDKMPPAVVPKTPSEPKR
jgi:Skp family chaperone for outer membrane proteins